MGRGFQSGSIGGGRSRSRSGVGDDVRNGAGRLAYRHAFHAGNTADVFKHTILCLLLRSMLKKGAPVVYVDTHSGAGMYDTMSGDGEQLKEWECGIQRVIEQAQETGQGEKFHDAIGDVAEVVAKWNRGMGGLGEAGAGGTSGALRYYPGSPLFAGGMLRQVDNIVAVERSEEIHSQLQAALDQLPEGSPQSTAVLGDGFRFLTSETRNFSSRRGLVFIDPAYQDGSDLERTVALAKHLRRSWRSARMAVCAKLPLHILKPQAATPARNQFTQISPPPIPLDQQQIGEEEEINQLPP